MCTSSICFSVVYAAGHRLHLSVFKIARRRFGGEYAGDLVCIHFFGDKIYPQ